MRVDLNADIGESATTVSTPSDDLLYHSITSGSIACGFHAGSPAVMRETVRRAARAGVAVGAHPGFPDREGFGRRETHADPQDIFDIVLYQVGALAGIARGEGVELRHVKPHGALYNLSARDAHAADAVASAVAAFDRRLILIGLANSESLRAGTRAGLRVAAEGFADRAYEADGTLTPRAVRDSVLSDARIVAARAVRMAREGTVEARDGSMVAVRIDTLCVHGDTPDAAGLAAATRQALDAAGIRVAALEHPGVSPED